MKSVIIDSQQKKTYLQTLIQELPEDGNHTVEVKKTDKSPTARQNRLMWKWYKEVADSGLGRNDTQEGVHIDSKWSFGRKIFERDDKDFYDLIHLCEKAWKYDERRSEKLLHFTKFHISTKDMTKHQKAEYLSKFERFWRGEGVPLTDPSLQGLDVKTFL